MFDVLKHSGLRLKSVQFSYTTFAAVLESLIKNQNAKKGEVFRGYLGESFGRLIRT